MAFPAYLSKTETGVTTSSNAVSVAAPAGVASGNYQLLVLSISSGSVTLGTTPSGWTLLADDQVDSSTSPDRGGSQRVALFESTSATGAFTMTLSGTARIWAAVRVAWTRPAGGGRTVALAKTIEATGTSTTSKALPAVNAGAVDSLAIGVGAADLTNASAWTGTGTYTQRSLYAAGSAAEWEYFAVGDRQVAASTAGVTGTFTMSPGDEAALYQVILDGTASATTVNKDATDSGTGSDAAAVSVPTSAADSGTGTESASVGLPIPSSDGGSGAEQVSSTAAVSGTDARTGTDVLSSQASLTAPLQTATGTDTGKIIIPAGDASSASSTAVQLTGYPAKTDTATGSDGVTIEGLFGDLVISLYAIHPTTGALVPLPDFTKLTLSPQRNSAGSISLEYPTTGLNFDLLRSTITSDRDLEVEIWNLGSPTGALRGYLQEAAGDDVSEDGLWTFAGGFLELRMSEAVVFPQEQGPLLPDDDDDPTNNQHANEKRELIFTASTPGGVGRFILSQAQARGTLTDITAGFTSQVDSNGTTWPKVISTKFSPGAGYDQILDKLVDLGLAEWAVTWTGSQKRLDMWVPEGRGVDRTLGNRPVVLRKGRNLLEAPRKWSVRDSGTALLAAGSEGVYESTSSADAQTRRGRRIELSASANNLDVSSAVQAFAQSQLAVSSTGLLEVTHGIGFLPGEPRPIVAFDVGDWVYSQTGTSMDRLRVVQWTLTVDARQNPSGTVTLNDTVQDSLVRLQRRLNALTSGETVVGTSESSQQEDTGVPVAPTGVIVGSTAYLVDGVAQSSVAVSWSPVTLNTDGSAATDLAGYRVQFAYAVNGVWQPAGEVAANSNTASFDASPGVNISCRVAAYDKNGNVSAWSDTVDHTTEDDTTPPPVPSTPVVTNYLGVLKIAWDGNSSAGTNMDAAAPDFEWCEVHLSQGSLFTPSTATLVGQMYAKGEWVVADLAYGVTYYARLVAVDTRGNASAPSAQGSDIPGQVVSADVFDGAIGTAKLADAAITTAKINDLAVNDAKIGTLSVGKLTAGTFSASMILSGIIRTATTGARAEIDGAGIRLYNAGGGLTVRLQATDGSALLTGTIQSALTGARLVINPGGTAADRINFYDDAGTTRAAYLYTYTVSGQANLIGRGSSARTDEKSGEFGAWPLEGYVRWVAPGSVNPNSSATARETEVLVEGPSIKFQRRDQFPNDGGARRVEWLVRNSSNTIVNASVLYLQSASGSEPWLQAPTSNSGIGFAGGNVTALFNNGALAAFTASAFNVNSSIAVKTAVQPLALPDTEGARGALRRAPAAMWKYRADLETERDWPDKPGGWADEHELEWHCKPFEAPWHVGPMAEDLPEWMVQHLDDGRAVVNVDNKVGFLWRVCEEQDRELRDLRARVDALTEPVIVDGEAC